MSEQQVTALFGSLDNVKEITTVMYEDVKGVKHDSKEKAAWANIEIAIKANVKAMERYEGDRNASIMVGYVTRYFEHLVKEQDYIDRMNALKQKPVATKAAPAEAVKTDDNKATPKKAA